MYVIATCALIAYAIFRGLRGLRNGLIYFAYLEPDPGHSNYLHAFAVRTISPEDGDSFDIFCYRLINIETGVITKGLQQRGNRFDINSEFAMRALANIRQKTGLNLTFSASNDESEQGKSPIPFVMSDEADSDTEVVRAHPPTCLVLRSAQARGENRFGIQYIEKGLKRGEAHFRGNADYLRRVIALNSQQLLIFSYASQARSYHDAALMCVDLKQATFQEIIVR